MEMDLLHMWANMNNLVRGVVVVLTLQALFCIYVVVDRIILLTLSGARSRAFAAEAGATVVLDGRDHPVEGDDTAEGFFVGPTVITGLSHKHPVDAQETFGPFLVIHKVSSLEEALEIANDTEFGNAAAVYTSSGKTAQEFELGCNSGNIGINTFPAPPMNFTMGGMGTSFFGDIHVCGDGAMHFYTDHKVVVTRW